MREDVRYTILKLGKLTIFIVIITALLLSVQTSAKKDLTGGKIDKINVVYAIDGYLTDSAGNQEPFIFGAVKLHKKNAPVDEWTSPNFYFEYKNKSTLALDTRYDYFTQPRGDGTLGVLPILKGIWAIASNYDYAKYNHEEYAEQGLVEGATPRDFEINFAFTKNGNIDTEKSSIGIVPEEYKTGRTVKRFAWFGEYYKKGSNIERFVPKRDAEGKVINFDDAGEPIFEEGPVNVSEVCYESSVAAIVPTPTPTPWKEKEKTPYAPQNDSSSNLAAPTAPNITQSLTPDEKEKTPAYDSQYKNTGLCSTRKVHSISRSAGLPDAYALGLIKAELKK